MHWMKQSRVYSRHDHRVCVCHLSRSKLHPYTKETYHINHYCHSRMSRCTPLQRHRSGKYSVKKTLLSVCSTLSKEAEKMYRPPFPRDRGLYTFSGRTSLCFINYLSTTVVVGFFSALNFISKCINGLVHDTIVKRK